MAVGALTLDLTRMQNSTLQRDSRTVLVQAGATPVSRCRLYRS